MSSTFAQPALCDPRWEEMKKRIRPAGFSFRACYNPPSFTKEPANLIIKLPDFGEAILRVLSVILVCVFVSVFLPASGLANQLELFGTSTRSLAMAGAYTAIAEGSDALYYNPGGLIQASRTRVDLSYMYTIPALFLERQESDGDTLDPTTETKTARRPENAQWLMAGITGALGSRVYLGLYTQVPIDGQERRKWFAPGQPYFIDYETGIFGLTFIPGVAVKLASNVGIGLALEVIFDAAGTQEIILPTQAEGVEIAGEGTGTLGAQAAPIVGFFARPIPELRLGLTYRGESYRRHKSKLDMEVIPGLSESVVEVEYDVIYNFNPATFSFGVAFEPMERFLLSAEVVYQAWSRYFPPYPNIDVDYSSLDDAGIDYSPPDEIDPEDVRPATHDTISPRFAVETRVYRNLLIDLGYKRNPSSLAFQRGTSSALDVDVNVFSMGFSVRTGGPFADRLRLDGGIQAHFLSGEHATKLESLMDENDPETNPLYPRYEVGGRYVSGGFTASYNF